jgi:transcription initiation factor IIE alpha subunit
MKNLQILRSIMQFFRRSGIFKYKKENKNRKAWMHAGADSYRKANSTRRRGAKQC